MTLQVLVATMNQPQGDHSLLEKMNIQSDAIVCNQCDYYDVEEFDYKGHHIKWMSFAERGVGLNRNNGLMRATADIVIFADDDMVFLDQYVDVVVYWMEKESNADVLLFQLTQEGAPLQLEKVVKRVGKHNFGKYGTARMVIRNSKIKLHGILFNTMFGGGCPYSCGEDSLFLSDCINARLRLRDIPDTIAKLSNERESTWFKGYTDKFFYDKGILYGIMNKRLAIFLSLYHCLKHHKRYSDYGWYNAFKQMCRGIASI